MTSGTDHRLSTVGLATVLLGVFLPQTDMFIVNVALPTIRADLHASPAMLELVVAGYGVAFALLLVPAGRLGDQLGRRRLFLAGIVAFTAASVWCGAAGSAAQLVTARTVQGAAAAVLLPQVLATIHATTSGPARARALGVYAAVTGAAASTGLAIGGVLISLGAGWRSIFLVNVPIGLVASLLALRHLPETTSPRPLRVDLAGTGLLAATVICLLLPATQGRTLGWPPWSWAMLACVPVTVTALAHLERSTERAGRTPLIPPSLVTLPGVRRGLAVVLPFFAGAGGFFFTYSLLTQQGLDAAPAVAGLSLATMTLGFLAASMTTARLTHRHGRGRVIAAGAATQALGLGIIATTVLTAWPGLPIVALLPGLVVAGCGQGLVVGPLFGAVLARIDTARAGVGSGLLVTTQQLALALGAAVLGSLFLELDELPGVSMGRAFAAVVAVQTVVALCVVPAGRRLDPAPVPTGS
ncbi:MFS transporter [Virgisporangium aurantiacum]|uniref:MFS transporter n=1 Tax=Virgisporangium aurantiacum TaxID=175570 RepID=A0A8J4DZX8_9ACTN|nr:MFS transporter [Virgisporangium aurantiacum]GIJ56424.1 MFS transporter [Virgisporangium aurantiacum]